MKSRSGDRQRLIHIKEAISEIENYTSAASFDSFISNSMMRFATIKQIEIIGEAANAMTEETRNEFRSVPWRQIIGLRHILVHEYFGIDNEVIWQIINSDIPLLKAEIQKILLLPEDDQPSA